MRSLPSDFFYLTDFGKPCELVIYRYLVPVNRCNDVREAGGYTKKDYGVVLMGKAFNEKNGNLTDQDQHPDEKKARKLLFLGAIGAYKNPSSHRDVEITAEEAAEVIIFASHLLGIVDTCAERISNPTN